MALKTRHYPGAALINETVPAPSIELLALKSSFPWRGFGHIEVNRVDEVSDHHTCPFEIVLSQRLGDVLPP